MHKSLFLLLTFTAVPALAEDDIVVVTADRTPEPLSRVGQSITVIDAPEIARRQVDSVTDLLRTVPGVTIARNGGVGAAASVFIRGAESEQTVALIDGVKLNDPAQPGGGFNFGNLLTGNIARIEVLRGPSSVLWGSQAIGGVVNIITQPPTDDLTVNLRGEYGYRNTATIVGNVSGTAGPLAASAGAGYYRTDGISAFDEHLGGREKDGYTNFGANANLRWTLSDAVSLDARGWYSNGHSAIDGFAPPTYAFGDTPDTSRTRQVVGYGGVNVALFGGRLRNRLGFAYTDTNRRDTDGGTPAFVTFASSGTNARIEYQGVATIADGWQATFGAEHELSRFATSSFGGPQERARATIDSGYGQLVATVLPGVTLTGGVRHDEHNRFGGATTFAGSGVWTWDATTLRGSYSEGFKVPSLYQLYGDYGNTTLRPERARGWDAGVTQKLVGGALEASATYFSRTSTDLIDFVSCDSPLTGICVNRPYGTYSNVKRAVSSGVELGLLLRPVEALTVQATYTYTNALNRAAGDPNYGRQLARRPQHSASVLADYRWSFGLETGATLTSVSTSFDNASNARRLPSYVLADLRGALPLGHGIALTARIENLFDEHYETAYQYGTLGRAAYVGARVRY